MMERPFFNKPRNYFDLAPDLNPFESQDVVPRPTFDPNAVSIADLPSEAPAKPSFLDRYNAELANRPERDRLRQLIEETPRREDFQPNKMTRLGAILGGVSAGWKNPAAGVELAQSTLDRPFNEAQAEYDRKLKNVSGLAGMESEDIQQRLKGLDIEREENRYERGERRTEERDRRADERDTRDYGLRVREFDARMGELEDKDWEKFTDEKTGEIGWTNRKTQQTIRGPKVNETLAESRAREDEIRKSQQQHAMNIARETTSRTLGAAEIRAGASETAQRLKAMANQFKPDDVNKKAYNDLADFALINDLGQAELDRLTTIDEASGRITVNANRTGRWRPDSADDIKLKDALRERLHQTYGGTPNAPSPATLGKGWSYEEVKPSKGGL
jgi:hypothetical protein